MTVYLDKQRNVWIYDFWLNGRRHKAMCRGVDGQPVSSRRQARAIEDSVRVGLRSESSSLQPPDSSEYSVAEAVAARAVEASKLKNFGDIKGMLSDILSFFGAATPLTVAARRWREYRAYCQQQPVRKWRGGPKPGGPKAGKRESLWGEQGRKRSAARVNRQLDQLSAIFRLAADNESSLGLPRLSKVPRIEKLKEPQRDPTPVPLSVLSKIEGDHNLPGHLRDAARLARLFGLRMAEVFCSQTTWIDWEAKALRVPASIAKSGREESLPANSEALSLLRRLTAEAQQRDSAKTHLIVYVPAGRDRNGNPFAARPIKSARRAWSTALNKHGGGQSWRFHDLRATFVTQVAHVATAATTQSLARHKSPITTARYIKIADQARRNAVDAMASPRDIVIEPMFDKRSPTVRSHPNVDTPQENTRKSKRSA
jgi:integrase